MLLSLQLLKSTQHNTTQHNTTQHRVPNTHYSTQTPTTMVCQTCNGSFTGIHNAATCPGKSKQLEGLAGCINIFKVIKTKKVTRKVTKSLDGLAGCQIFKEPKANKSESKTRCGQCGLIGHNSRTCQNRCQPCSDQSARAFCFAGFSAVQATSIANML